MVRLFGSSQHPLEAVVTVRIKMDAWEGDMGAERYRGGLFIKAQSQKGSIQYGFAGKGNWQVYPRYPKLI